MTEATAMSLPDEVMIEILSRVDSSNHLELRCVCKLWKSLVLDPLFMKNHFLTSITDLASLCRKANEQFNALKSRIQEEQEKEDNNEEYLDLDFNGAADEEEEEEEEDGDVDAEEEEEEEEYSNKNVLAELTKFMEKEKQLEKKGENVDNLDEKWMIFKVAVLDNSLLFVRYVKNFTLNFVESIKSMKDRVELKANSESIRVEMQTMEYKMKCLEIFTQIYLKEQKKFRFIL